MQESLLARGPNFAIVPKYPPKSHTSQWWKMFVPNSPPEKQMNLDLISATYLGTPTTTTQPTSPYRNAGHQQNVSRIHQGWYFLTADKGVAMVIMEKQDYTNKAQAPLQDTSTCKVLNKDPTSRLKNKLIQTLKDIKQSGGISDSKYRKLCLTSSVPPMFYGLPKIHKVGTPSGP